MSEDEILLRIDLEQRLAKLGPLYRAVVLLREGFWQPADYDGPWPPTYSSIGRYVGVRFRGKEFSESAVRHTYAVALQMMRGTFVDGRKRH